LHHIISLYVFELHDGMTPVGLNNVVGSVTFINRVID